MPARLETKIAAGAIFTFAIFGIACFLSYQSVRDANETARTVAHTYQILSQLNSALAHLTDAEAGTRGYLLTGDSAYLERQKENFISSDAALRELTSLTEGNSGQQRRVAFLRQKFAEKVAFLHNVTQLRQGGNASSARAAFETGRGREVMNDVRQVANGMSKEEHQLLSERQRRARASAAHNVRIVIIAGLLDGLLLALAFLTIRREMRARQQLEQALRHEAEQLSIANEELEAFSYSVSHDLRAPLRHISGFGDLLERQLGPVADEKARRYLAVIGQSTRHMSQLIDDLLAFARVGRAHLRRSRVDLTGLVRSVIRDLQPAWEGREVDWQIAPLPQVNADAGMMRQVYTNLLDNALKYTRPRSRAVIEIGSSALASEMIFHVRDNGVGFDAQYAAKLFKVFQRLHQAEEFEGTGVGLANVHRVIQKHGGRTWAESDAENGATFYFSLPLGEVDAG